MLINPLHNAHIVITRYRIYMIEIYNRKPSNISSRASIPSVPREKRRVEKIARFYAGCAVGRDNLRLLDDSIFIVEAP